MKVLLYDWSPQRGNLYSRDIRDTFRDMGISFEPFQFDFENQKISELEMLFSEVDTAIYDCCFSVNYFPELSNFCYRHNLKYISWGYDCPFNVRNIEETLGNSCNFIFCFDRMQARGYQRQGFDNVYHLPLGINVSRYKKINPSAEQRKKYAAQVSFIGSLYEGQYSALKEICDSYTKGYLEAVINSQQQLYGAYILNDVVSPALVQRMNDHFKELDSTTKFQLDKPGLVHILDQETSRRERLLLLNLLGKRFDTVMYSYQDYPMLQGVKCRGTVDYFDEMPYVFASSKINLNISVKGIQSGMPLRTLDVMASGGFLLSNYQQELVEYFSYGEDMVVYESMEDAIEKCYYYLENEELRRQIAENGRKRVLEEHNLVDKIKAMLEVAEIGF